MRHCQFKTHEVTCREPAKWQARILNPSTGNRSRIFCCPRHKTNWPGAHIADEIPWGSYVPDPPEI